MATCNDIDNSLASLKASNDAKFAAMQARIDACCAKTDEALTKALEALGKIADLIDSINDVLKTIKGLANALKALEGVVNGGLGTLAGLVGTVANLALSIAALNTLGGRMDGLEAETARLGNEVGSNYQDLFLRIRNISLTPGPKGDRGEKGDAGRTPVKGVDYFDGQNGQDGRTPVKGVDYFDGQNGQDGRTPVKGVDYFDGQNGQDGYTPVFGVDYFNGQDGVDGVDGINGTDGVDGINGTDGVDGINGTDGVDGINGTDGVDGINGTDGVDGINGTDGVDGINGTDGVDGINGTDGVDKGMDCTEMQACIKPQTDILTDILGRLSVTIEGSLVAEECPPPRIPPSVPHGQPNPDNQNPIDWLIDEIVEFAVGELVSSLFGALLPGPVDDVLWRAIVRAFFEDKAKDFMKDKILDVIPRSNLFSAPLTDVPQIIRPNDPTPVKGYKDADGKVRLTYEGKGLSGIINAIEALSEQQNSMLLQLCEPKVIQPTPKPDECVVIALEPSDKWAEKNIETQLQITFIPKGDTYTATTPKWRITVPNPRDNLTWADFAPLDYMRGTTVGRLFWQDTTSWSGSYFKDDIIGLDFLDKIKDLSTAIPKYPLPRFTVNGSPKRQPDEIEVMPYYAVIAEVNGSKITKTKCFKRPS